MTPAFGQSSVWNGVLARHGDAALLRQPPPDGARILDIGCGFGDTTLELARRTGPYGRVVGVDPAPRCIEAARRLAQAAGAPQVSFRVGDVQTDPVGGPYDYAYSRFGTLAFAAPVVAFRNLLRALAPGAPLVIVVWRHRESFQIWHELEDCLRSLCTAPALSGPENAGGPFCFASADRVTDVLHAAGFAAISLARFDATVCIGSSAPHAVELLTESGPAAELLRQSAAVDAPLHGRVREALERLVARHTRADGVWSGSSSWTVVARA